MKAFAGTLLEGLGQALESFGKAALLASALMKKFLDAMSTLNPFAAAAAAIGMIALGALISGAAQSAFSGGGAGGGSAGVGPQDTTTNITYYAPGATPAPQAAPLSAVAAVPAPRMGDVSQLRTMQPININNPVLMGSWTPDMQRLMMREIAEARRRGF